MSTFSDTTKVGTLIRSTSAGEKKPSSIILILFACTLSFLLFSLIGELIVRFYLNFKTIYDIEMSKYAIELKIQSENPKIRHKHRPNSQAHLMNVDVRINSDGLRDHEHSIEKNGKYRIAFLGDSLTFGWGVREEENFKSLLEKKFNQLQPVDIINFGTGNYNTEQEVNLFLESGLKYSPNKVVVFYFINDAEPTRSKSPWSFLENSRMLSFYWSRINNLLGRWNTDRSFYSFYSRLYDDQQEGWKNTKAALSQLNEECKKRNISLQVVLLPELHELKNYPFQKQHNMVLKHLRSLNIAYLDITDNFKSFSKPTELWVSSDDAHPNALAHSMISDFVHDFIKPSHKRQEDL
ncbi:MAG: SGNH/GDSL hydrolase family protein [Deltaproteobacteria bacterium]